jgi:hypothetical protein
MTKLVVGFRNFANAPKKRHLQLYISFITNIYMFRSPSATTLRVRSINITSTIEVVYDELKILYYFYNVLNLGGFRCTLVVLYSWYSDCTL